MVAGLVRRTAARSGDGRRQLTADLGLLALLAIASALLGADVFLGTQFEQKLLSSFSSEHAWRLHVLWWWLAALPAMAGLLIRRRWPVPAFLLAAASAVLHLLDPHFAHLPIDFVVLVTLYAVASHARSRRVGVLLLAAAVLGLCAITLALQFGVGQNTDTKRTVINKAAAHGKQTGQTITTPSLPAAAYPAFSEAVVPALLLGIAWAVGDSTRTRRAHLTTLEQRAADLERERDQRAALATAAERSRITRELHDVVAHGLSVMVVQAQGGAAALRRHPDRTAAALTNVIDTGRASLAEMRRLLGLARANPGQAPDLAPQPGIGALPALVDQIRDAGTAVRLRVEGEPVPLPPSVDLSAYRIVQEALTNTLKHAGDGAQATVRLMFQPGELEIDVADDGGGPVLERDRDAVGGNGLRGIVERVGLLGGQVAAGPRDEGGFRVHAVIPVAAT
jgi:signal transduction histidine kinase